MSDVPHEHHEQAPHTLRWAVITVSDSRDSDDDESGHLLVHALQNAGHQVLEQLLLPDDMDEIRGTVSMLARDPELDAIITTGGTGASVRDVSIEAVGPLVGKVLPGFGELFRHLSYETIGPAAYLSRAQAATIPAPDAVKVLYQLPGSPDACELAIADLIIPEAAHLFAQANHGLDLEERFKGAGDGDGERPPPPEGAR